VKSAHGSSSFGDILRTRAQEKPDAAAFLFRGDDGESRLTYGELHARAESIGEAIVAAGRGNALLIYPPGFDFVAALFGCFYAGAIAIPVYPPDPDARARTTLRLLAAFRDARPRLALTTAAIAPAIDQLLSAEHGERISLLSTDSLCSPGAGSLRLPDATGGDVALLQYTSGSTATPRGVMLTHANLVHNSDFIQRRFAHSNQSRGVIWLPPYHDMGLIGGVLQPVYAGFPCILMSPLTFLRRPLNWLRAISDHHATVSGGPNFAFDLCVRRIGAEQRTGLDLSSWDVAFNGAEPIRSETIEAFSESFKDCGFRPDAFVPCYGLAESTLMVTSGTRLSEARVLHRAGKRLVSCGRPDQGHRVVIADPASGAHLAEGKEGEIWVCGASVAAGYWERPVETKAAFGVTPYEETGSSCLRTGDLGLLLDGELYVTGRIKELVIVGGRNLHPLDIELACERAAPQLRPGCGAAFSFEPDGREQIAVVYEVTADPSVDYGAVIRAIRNAVARTIQAQVHTIVLIVPKTIPKTPSGKVQRQLCRSLLAGGKLEVIAEWSLPAERPGTPAGVAST
jgi:acyl-CoA synthetase (AMP-forming)/AMP-acid ligase II